MPPPPADLVLDTTGATVTFSTGADRVTFAPTADRLHVEEAAP